MSIGIASLLLVCCAVQTTTVVTLSVSGTQRNSSSVSSANSNATTPSQSLSSTSSSSSNSSANGTAVAKSSSSKKHPSGGGGKLAKFSRLHGAVGRSHLPLGYRYKYASDFDSYVSSSYSYGGSLGLIDIDTLDTDLDLHEPIWFPLHYELIDLDLDTEDLDDVDLDLDLDLDLLKLKYGLYGLNHYSLHNPRFNEYRFRRRYRSSSRPYFRAQHRYLPTYWKHDLDFWGLDNYGLGFDYDKYSYFYSTPTSYSHVSTFL